MLKEARVTPLVKKPTLDPDIASSYRPISNLSFISKHIERLVVKRFSVHVNQHTLLPALPNNPPTDLSTLLRLPYSASTTTWSVQSMTAVSLSLY